MKKITVLKLALVAMLSLSLNSCCEKPKVIIKKEYIECKYPIVLDLNYSNDTNYSISPIKYRVIERSSHAS